MFYLHSLKLILYCNHQNINIYIYNHLHTCDWEGTKEALLMVEIQLTTVWIYKLRYQLVYNATYFRHGSFSEGRISPAPKSCNFSHFAGIPILRNLLGYDGMTLSHHSPSIYNGMEEVLGTIDALVGLHVKGPTRSRQWPTTAANRR